jgi:hypothetical protein
VVRCTVASFFWHLAQSISFVANAERSRAGPKATENNRGGLPASAATSWAIWSSVVEVNPRLPWVDVVAAHYEIGPADIQSRSAKKPTSPVNLNVRRLVGLAIMMNENMRTELWSQTPQLPRKVRPHFGGPKACLLRIIHQHLGGPCLKLRSGYDLTGVLLQVIKLPDRFAGRLDAAPQNNH